jgi:superfamily II RNA helicase
MIPLTDRIPDDTSDEGALLEAFFDWVAETGIEPYPAQEEAILEIFSGQHVILNTPTGSGKSLVATAAHFYALARGERSFYTSPIKALVSEKFFALCDAFGAEYVGMMTGDAAINRDAPIICCTAEVLSNLALRQGEVADVHLVIMDEFHYYGDRDRGRAWQIPLLLLPRAAFLLLSATLGDTTQIVESLETLTGRAVSTVTSVQRPVPLVYDWAETPLLETIDDLITRDRAPVYVVNFSQREAAELAQSLLSVNFCTTEEKQTISAALGAFRFDSPYGKKIRRFVHHGVGLHHAGLLPKYRRLVERLAQQGLLKVICGTDTLGVGVNVPIRSVLFTRLYKYDGEKSRLLTIRDFRQIGGRAGRKGYDTMGWVVCQAPAHVIENAKLEAKAASQKGAKKKFTRRQPDRGYVAYDEVTFRRMIEAPSEDLRSVFEVDHGMILHLLQRAPEHAGQGGGYGALVRLIARTHEPPARQRAHRRNAARLFRALREAGLVYLARRTDGPGSSRVALSEELSEDFSVFHTLALWLLEVLMTVDLEDENAGLFIVTLVESILESPMPILQAQQHRERGERVAELKAAGVEYEERMELLEKVTWPKPHAEEIWATFDTFSEHHPWVGHANIQPKSIAREIWEKFATFNEYVAELGIETIEGVLLRYLSHTYKTLVQSVPEMYRTDQLVEVIGFLRAMLARVDSSLVQEWEHMLAPGDETDEATRVVPDITRDRRTFRARVRAEVHQLVRSLARGDWEDAANAIAPASDASWTAERFAAEMAPYFQEFDRLVFDHTARLAEHTTLRETGDHQFHVRQTLLDPESTGAWFFEAEIDLRDDPAPEGPILRPVRISDGSW